MIAGSEFPDGVRSICEDSEAEEMFGVKFVRKGLKEGSFDFFISDGLGVGVGFFAPTFFSLFLPLLFRFLRCHTKLQLCLRTIQEKQLLVQNFLFLRLDA